MPPELLKEKRRKREGGKERKKTGKQRRQERRKGKRKSQREKRIPVAGGKHCVWNLKKLAHEAQGLSNLLKTEIF